MSGAPQARSTSVNSFSTSARLLASHAKASAPVSRVSASRSPVERAASATRILSFAKARASDADSPAPAPTIRAVLNLISVMANFPGIRFAAGQISPQARNTRIDLRGRVSPSGRAPDLGAAGRRDGHAVARIFVELVA